MIKLPNRPVYVDNRTATFDGRTFSRIRVWTDGDRKTIEISGDELLANGNVLGNQTIKARFRSFRAAFRWAQANLQYA